MFVQKGKADTDRGVADIHDKDLIGLHMEDASLPKTAAVSREAARHKTGQQDQQHKTPGHGRQYQRADPALIADDHEDAKEKFDPWNHMSQKRNKNIRDDLISGHAPLKIFNRLHELGEPGIREDKPDENPSQKKDLVIFL